MTRSPVIAGVKVGAGLPCRFVAEISNNHNGSLEQAFALLRAAKTAGADFAKFQCYTPEELVLLRGDGPAPGQWGEAGYTMQSLYERARTPLEWFPDLFRYAATIGLPVFSSVFGKGSLALMEGLGCPAYKIARLDNHHRVLVDAVCATKKPTIVSAYGDDRVRHIDLLLACPPGYPQSPTAEFPSRFGGDWDGTSYHGTNPEIPARHALNGARMVEVHLQLEDEPSLLEANISLTERQFAQMVLGARHGFTESLPLL